MIAFVDLDGVLVDFRRGVGEALGISHEMTHTYKWNFWEDADKTREQVNDICTSDFWAGLSWTLDGHEIFRTITRYIKPENIYLLTCPMPNLESASGKARWVDKHMPFYNDRLIITRAPKRLLAGPNRLLIDDNDDNISSFIWADGMGVLVPRPWNLLSDCTDRVIQHIEQELDFLKAEEIL